MKITRRQLRQIIAEAIDPRKLEEPLSGWTGDALPGDPHYSMKFGMDIHDSVIGILSGTFMGGIELAARVIDELAELAPNLTRNEVFDVMDEMLEDHTLIFDDEEDEWSLV